MENENEINETEEMVEEEGQSKFKQWLQDNLRIIISILIVVAIAGGIYSYSNRTEVSNDTTSKESILSEETTEEGAIGEKGTATEQTDKKAETAKDTVAQTPKAQTAPKAEAAPSQETEKSFIETAAKGDGMTHLARRALANYLEKNPDSSLTPEHKIYIEDYLRKNVAKQKVKVGTSVDFSKDLIKDAIAKSKTLNEKQLQNLHKYAVMVPSLS